MHTRETCVRKYHECKSIRNGEIPEYREFLKYAGIHKRQLDSLFGASAYSKLQIAAGDVPNKLQMEPVQYATIMKQYGNLVTELGVIPPAAEWLQRGLKPTESGLRQKPHNMKWSELPSKFKEWVTANKVTGFDKAMKVIDATGSTSGNSPGDVDAYFSRLIKEVRVWTPDRRRNSEEVYKVELRNHLESLNYEVNEEYGESRFDLLVRGKYAIELKKDPDLGEYDRLFGQLARHLQHELSVIVLILQATRNDKYDNFVALVDRYLNIEANSVEVIKK